jgi:hypothetical protein
VTSGVRFDVSLDGALPETLVYPDSVPVIVTTGATRQELQATIKKVTDLLQTDYAGGRYDSNFREACGVLSSLNTADLTDVLKALDARFLENLLLHFNEALKDGLVDERLLVLAQSIEYEQSSATTKFEDKFYVDNFSSWSVDPSSFGRPDPGREKAGKWNIKIIFQYGNLTPERAIAVYADDILDYDVKPPAFNHQGAWGLLYPAAFTKGTVPRMWAAKKQAINQIEEGNVQFILTAYAASQAVLDLVLLGAGMLTRTIPAATTGRISSGLAARGGPFGTGGRMPQEIYPYVNRNPRATAEEIRLGTFLASRHRPASCPAWCASSAPPRARRPACARATTGSSASTAPRPRRTHYSRSPAAPTTSTARSWARRHRQRSSSSNSAPATAARSATRTRLRQPARRSMTAAVYGG